MATILKVWHLIENPTLSIDAYLLEEQSCQSSSRSDLKWRSLKLFEEVAPKEQEQEDHGDHNYTRQD